VLFFAAAAEAVGKRQQIVTLERGATIADVVAEIHPSLAALQYACAFAIDEKLMPIDTKLTDGCTIAVLPPVSGG
jgi:molybdopterin converting factor small subunit